MTAEFSFPFFPPNCYVPTAESCVCTQYLYFSKDRINFKRWKIICFRWNYPMTFHDMPFSVPTIIHRVACVISRRSSENGGIVLILQKRNYSQKCWVSCPKPSRLQSMDSFLDSWHHPLEVTSPAKISSRKWHHFKEDRRRPCLLALTAMLHVERRLHYPFLGFMTSC